MNETEVMWMAWDIEAERFSLRVYPGWQKEDLIDNLQNLFGDDWKKEYKLKKVWLIEVPNKKVKA